MKHKFVHTTPIVYTPYVCVCFFSCMSMAALLKKLTKHTKGQTRDALRMQVSAYNGLAGLHILKDDVRLIICVPSVWCMSL
jgi:hypothetical protein